MPIVPLPDASEGCGAKARNLGLLLRAGFRVPDGFVIPDPLGNPGREREIEAGLRRLGPGPFAVRSSALAEDGAESSFAGQLATTLGVTTTAEVIEAVHRSAARARAWAVVSSCPPRCRATCTCTPSTRYASGVTVPATTASPRPRAASITTCSAPVTGCRVNMTPAVAGCTITCTITPADAGASRSVRAA